MAENKKSKKYPTWSQNYSIHYTQNHTNSFRFEFMRVDKKSKIWSKNEVLENRHFRCYMPDFTVKLKLD